MRILSMLFLGVVLSLLVLSMACGARGGDGDARPQIPPLVISVAGLATTGDLKTATATVIQGADYIWTIQNGNVVSGSTSTTVSFRVGAPGYVTLSCSANVGGQVANSSTLIEVLPLPVVNSFQANPASIQAGGSTQLSADFQYGVGIIEPGSMAVTSGIPVTAAPAVDTVYTLTVSNQAGGSISSVVLVAVTPTHVMAPDIHAVGTGQGNPWPVPYYWKNGTPHVLEPNGGTANGILVDSGDVYVVGSKQTQVRRVAEGWVNGVPMHLTDESVVSEAYSVIKLGNDVYVAGEIDLPATGGGAAKRTPVLWKNGLMTKLPFLGSEEPIGAAAAGIAASGSDIYVVGNGWVTYPITISVFQPVPSGVIWKNLFPGALGGVRGGAFARAIAVDGPDIYAAGMAYFAAYPSALYWKNGVLVALTDGTGSAEANAITVVNGDVYVAGREGRGSAFFAVYWKNGVRVQLTDGTQGASANSIMVSGGDVYVGGHEGGVAKYWKNASPVLLANEAKTSMVNAIYLVMN